MTAVEQIQDALRRLTPDERAAFRSWYAEFDAGKWDRQIEADGLAGKLDWLVKEARDDHKAGRCTDR